MTAPHGTRYAVHLVAATATLLLVAAAGGLAGAEPGVAPAPLVSPVHPLPDFDRYDPTAQSISRALNERYVWANGPPDDPAYFPIAVWLQHYSNAPAYRDIGINLFVGQWQGPTADQLTGLTAAGMPAIATQNEVGLQRLADPILQGWLQQDEPDNAQSDGQGGYGPCVDPAEIIARYERMKANDPSRPVLLNLGQGVAWDYDRPYVGRGSHCSRKWEQYYDYVKGADIVSFDIYPVTSPYDHIQDRLWLVARGVDRLREWTGDERIVWNVIETTHIHSQNMPTPHQVRAEIWMSLIHGSMGIVYFAHEWEPQFREAALLHYPKMRDAVGAINHEIIMLAPVLNSPSANSSARLINTSNPEVPIDVMVKEHDGWVYLFAVAMRAAETQATFAIGPGSSRGEVEVIGENRSLTVESGTFRDDFVGYGVHLYRKRLPARAYLPMLDTPRGP